MCDNLLSCTLFVPQLLKPLVLKASYILYRKIDISTTPNKFPLIIFNNTKQYKF